MDFRIQLLKLIKLLELLEQFKSPLLGLVASLHQVLECLLAQSVLLLAHNATLVLHQILAGQTTGSVLSTTMPHLCLRAHCRNFTRAACATCHVLNALSNLGDTCCCVGHF